MNDTPFRIVGALMGAVMLGAFDALMGAPWVTVFVAAAIGLAFGYWLSLRILKKLGLPSTAKMADVNAAARATNASK